MFSLCLLPETDFSYYFKKERKHLHSLCRYTTIKSFGVMFLERKLPVKMVSAASNNSHLNRAI